MREFLSKAIAGGLSAGVVLLWWPMLFEIDTVTSWLIRGVMWTVLFEILLLALLPFERALWETSRGERITRRVGAAGSRLHTGSHRRRMGRLSAIATIALVIPVALLVTGLHERAPDRTAAAKAKPTTVVQVTRIVRPLTVKRVVERVPVLGQPIVVHDEASPPPVTEGARKTVVPRVAPVERGTLEPEQTDTPQEPAEPCLGDACGSTAPPASGSAS